MNYRHIIGQSLHMIGLSRRCGSGCSLSAQAARVISTSGFRLWPDVIVPSMGESIKEGSIAAVLKQVGQPVREDEVIAQIETDKVTIDIKAPSAGFVQQLNIKPADLVVAGQVVAVVGATAPAGGAALAAAAAPGKGESGGAAGAAASTSGRKPMIHFPPRFAASGLRISDLPEAEYKAALAAAEAAANAAPASPAWAAAPKPEAPPPPAAASVYPVPAAKAAPPPFSKNKLQYITRPDGRGGPPRRPLSERELDMINLGGVY